MLLLLAGSAFFSGAETAFFNLSRREKLLLQKSTHKLQHLVGRLLDRPSRLLGCLLLGNMTVNVLFFAVGSTLTPPPWSPFPPWFCSANCCLSHLPTRIPNLSVSPPPCLPTCP
ncbi:MAG: CNNM domain-containing protein [Planctomycetota bacterium]